MDLGDQRAGGIEEEQLEERASCGTAFGTPWAEKMTGCSPSGTSSSLLDEDRALLLQILHHIAVVDDLVAHIDPLAIALERLLDNVDRPDDAGTKPRGAARTSFIGRFGGVVISPRSQVGLRFMTR